MYLTNPFFARDYQFEGAVNYCFVGIRRTGKSYMLYQQIKNLADKGIPMNQIVYVNFEDERLLEISTDELNLILEIALENTGSDNSDSKPFLFFDEIQNVNGWEKFVRRVADMKYRVSITGSNSKMLSKEIASTLGGRFMTMQIFPYSFSEYLMANGKSAIHSGVLSTPEKAEISALYEQYVQFGAFPELVEIRNKRDYLNSIFKTIYLGDIITRNKITNDFAIRLILKKIAESVMNPLSFSRLTNILKSAGAAIGKQTVINYVGYMVESYMLFTVQNYAARLVEKESSPKYYFMDTGLIALMAMNPECAQLENLVAIQLVHRYDYDEVYYFESNIEVDFYIPSENLAIQVCYSLEANFDTRERELGAFTKLRKFLPDAKCLVITNSEEAEIEQNGFSISVIPAWKWMLALKF